jgi:hypothetical protein
MFNWFDKLLVKIAKKILNKYAPTGEFIAYINEREEKVLKDLGGYGQPINETGVKSFIDIGAFIEGATDFYEENKDLVHKVGSGLVKAWIDMNDQERKNAVTEKAYKDYMSQVESAGKEAEAAVAMNLTPMEITNVPTTKADVTDFTLVAARGGLMNLPTRHRKRYAYGPNEIDVEAMQEESIGPYELQMEEGVNIGPMVEEDKQKQLLKAFADYQAAGGTLSLKEFAVMWMQENAARTVEGDMKMASAPGIPGIEGLRHGGRPGYADSNAEEFETIDFGRVNPYGGAPKEGALETINFENESPYNMIEITEPENTLVENEDGINVVLMGNEATEFNQLKDTFIKMGLDEKEAEKRALKLIKQEFEIKFKKGGRVKYAQGSGIMDLGGLEKDYRTTGGFVPIGGRERADDVPARLSKNEFVMTADAVRAAGGGSINKGAQRMYNTMKHLEAQPQARRMIS